LTGDYFGVLEKMAEPLRTEDCIEILRCAPRSGTQRDDPEGTSIVMLSSTLANKIADIAEELSLREKNRVRG
jgi:hypothetical protein